MNDKQIKLAQEIFDKLYEYRKLLKGNAIDNENFFWIKKEGGQVVCVSDCWYHMIENIYHIHRLFKKQGKPVPEILTEE